MMNYERQAAPGALMGHVHRCVSCDPDIRMRLQSNPSDHITLNDGALSLGVSVYQGDAKLLRCQAARPGAWIVQHSQPPHWGPHHCPCGGPAPVSGQEWINDGAGMCLELVEGPFHCTYGKDGAPLTQEQWAAWHGQVG